MNDEHDRKALNERQVFASCVKAAGLALDPGSIESRQPPEPDIRCTVCGDPRRIEMVEIVDRQLAEGRAEAMRTHQPTGGAFSAEDPLFHAVASKYEKTYETGGEPLFLIAYYDKQYPNTSVDPSVVPRTIHGVAQSMLTFGGWSGLWVFDTWNQCILWGYPTDVAVRWMNTT